MQKQTQMGSFFQFNSGKIHYSDQGKGTVVVLIHGYPETSEVWNSFAKRLAVDFRTISVDLPGHGLSDMYGEILTMDFMACILKSLLEYLNIKKAFLTGHSLGGYVALAFADLYPEKLSGYCLFHSQPFADTPETIAKRENEVSLIREGRKDKFLTGNIEKMYAGASFRKFPDAVLRSKEIALTIPGEALTGVLKGMMVRSSKLSILESGKIPCLWILGAMDDYINCEQTHAKVRIPANAKLEILKNSGHLGFIEEEEKSVKVITEFVRKCT